MLKKNKMKQNSRIRNLRISARTAAIVTNMFCGVPQSLQKRYVSVDVAVPAGTGSWCSDVPVGDDVGNKKSKRPNL
jgi:hypothetical protein